MAVVKQHFTRSSGGLSDTLRVRRVGPLLVEARETPATKDKAATQQTVPHATRKGEGQRFPGKSGASLFALWVVLQNKNATAKDEGHPQQFQRTGRISPNDNAQHESP